MINSLLKDSHITLSKRIPNSSYSERCTYESSLKRTAPAHRMNNDNFNITVNKPAEISFSGFSCARDLESLESKSLKNLLNAAKTFIKNDKNIDSLDIKKLQKSTKNLIEKTLDAFQNPEKEALDGAVRKFLETESHNENVKTLLDDAKSVIKSSDKNIDYNSQEYKKVVKGYINEAVDVLHSVENPSRFRNWLYKNKGVKKFIIQAEKNQAVFSALFAAGLACFIRPATIIALPSKKNKENQKYAAAHSIGSGFIGYVFAIIVSSPIAKAVDKIAKNPTKFLGETKTEFFANKKVSVDVKKAIEIGETKRFSIARSYMNMIPEILTAVPKAVLTIALIPPILKYVFGLEKKSSKKDNITPITQNYTEINFKSADATKKKVFQNFMGGN